MRNVEQCFHMADLQEGHIVGGAGASIVSHLIGCIQLHWQRQDGGECERDSE